MMVKFITGPNPSSFKGSSPKKGQKTKCILLTKMMQKHPNNKGQQPSTREMTVGQFSWFRFRTCGPLVDGNQEAPRTSSARVSGARTGAKASASHRSASRHRLYGVGQSASARQADRPIQRLLTDYRGVGNRRVSEGR